MKRKIYYKSFDELRERLKMESLGDATSARLLYEARAEYKDMPQEMFEHTDMAHQVTKAFVTLGAACNILDCTIDELAARVPFTAPDSSVLQA